MLANEARKTASEKIWNSLPGIIRYNIEDAVNEGGLNCASWTVEVPFIHNILP